MKRTFLLMAVFAICATPWRMAQALTISNVSFSNTSIPFETSGVPNGTTVSFTIDAPGQVQINIFGGIQSFSDTGVQVAALTQSYNVAGAQSIFWNGLWLINGDQGRSDSNFRFTLTLSTGSTVGTSITPTQLVSITSIDIHSVSVAPSLDSNNLATFPFAISYALAKAGNVTMTVTNSSGTVVRTLLSNRLQAAETVSTNTINWNGLGDDGRTVPLGIYTVTINAVDPTNSDAAITRTRQITVQSLAGAAADPQKLFEDSVFVYPNPVRNGQGIFQFEAIRDGATISLKIYTLSGDLVRSETFGNVPTGAIDSFTWNATNQSGNKVGRGLYYYVVREEDSQGTLQVVKKMAVLP